MSRPAASGLLIAFRNGWLVSITIVWAWKYGRSFLTAVTKANASFSKGGYLSSAPLSAQLV